MNTEDFEEIESELKQIKEASEKALNEMEYDSKIQDVYEAYIRTAQFLEERNIILTGIRKHILGQFTLFKNYTVEDYDKAMRDLNELIDMVGQ